jgi:CheY-like chemotaxis protein
MPDMDGLELLRRAHEIDPDLPVIVITAFASIESAVRAVKEGAFDYPPKPFTGEQPASPSTASGNALQRENRNLRQQLQGDPRLETIIGRSPARCESSADQEGGAVGGQHPRPASPTARSSWHAPSMRTASASQPFVPVDALHV